ncbi:hypothetical protein MRX96_010228 [Rhipicephalus microplus]
MHPASSLVSADTVRNGRTWAKVDEQKRGKERNTADLLSFLSRSGPLVRRGGAGPESTQGGVAARCFHRGGERATRCCRRRPYCCLHDVSRSSASALLCEPPV